MELSISKEELEQLVIEYVALKLEKKVKPTDIYFKVDHDGLLECAVVDLNCGLPNYPIPITGNLSRI